MRNKFFFAEERTSFARIYVTLVCCELLRANGTNPKTAACILVIMILCDTAATVSKTEAARMMVISKIACVLKNLWISARTFKFCVNSKCKSEILTQY